MGMLAAAEVARPALRRHLRREPRQVPGKGSGEERLTDASPARVWVDVALAVVALAAAGLVLLDVPGPLRVAVVAAALLCVPGVVVQRRLRVGDPWASLGLVVALSLAVGSALALAMLWSGAWLPTLAAGVGWPVAAALLLRDAWTTRAVTSGSPARSLPWRRPPHRRPSSWSGVQPTGHGRTGRHRAFGGRLEDLRTAAPWLLLALAVPLWVDALSRVELEHLGGWGLLPALPLTWYAALAIGLGVVVLGLVGPVVRTPLVTTATAVVLAVLYGTAPIVEDTPRYLWTYKHIGVTRYIEAHGGLDASIDIYHRWPGFFALSALFGEWTGLTNPLDYAAWAETFFAVVDAVLVLGIARAISRDIRWQWTAVVLFSVGNWVGQNYYAPQAFAYTLYLALMLLVTRCLTGEPGKLGRAFEARLRRPKARAAGVASAVSGGRGRTIVAVLALHAVVVASHQLTPYLLVASLLPLFVLGYLRPRWLPFAMGAITLAYLLPHAGYIDQHFGLTSGVNPLANATYTPVDRDVLPAARAWQAAAAQLLSGGLALLGAVGLVRRLRSGNVRSALTVAVLAGAPLLLVLGQSYGGEARLRVILFSLPWTAMAAAWAFRPSMRTGCRPRTNVALALTLTVATACFTCAYFGAEADNVVPRSEITAVQWAADHLARGATVVPAAPTLSLRHVANYDELLLPWGADPWSIADMRESYPTPMSQADEESLLHDVVTQGNGGYVVFSPRQQLFAERQRMMSARELEGLEAALSRADGVEVVYRNGETRVYRLGR